MESKIIPLEDYYPQICITKSKINSRLENLKIRFRDINGIAQLAHIKIKFNISNYLMCIDDKKKYSSLIGMERNNANLNQNESILFNNLAIGQVYLIEFLPDVVSKYCSDKKCPSFKYGNSDWNNSTCEVCHKMILVLQSNELNQLKFDQENCFENVYKLDERLDENISLEMLLKHVYIVKISTEIKLNPRILSYSSSEFNKNHFCSVEPKITNFKEPLISSKVMYIIIAIKIIVLLTVSAVLILKYYHWLYSEIHLNFNNLLIKFSFFFPKTNISKV